MDGWMDGWMDDGWIEKSCILDDDESSDGGGDVGWFRLDDGWIADKRWTIRHEDKKNFEKFLKIEFGLPDFAKSD